MKLTLHVRIEIVLYILMFLFLAWVAVETERLDGYTRTITSADHS
jgi:hypothetical protein